MNLDCGNIIDRFTISHLKFNRIGTEESVKEFNAFKEEMDNIKEKYDKYDWDQFCNMMYSINSTIWFLEASIKGNKNILPNPHHLDDPVNNEILTNIGKNTILIRNVNNLRVNFKNIVNKLVGTGFQDLKRDHSSEGE